MSEGDQAGSSRITEVLRELRAGSPGAGEELFQAVYAELHRIAAAKMRRQRPDHTLQPTALVHEAYLRLIGSPEASWKDRSHFLAAASRAMRSILVDFARSRGAQKRGGGRKRITLDEHLHAEPRTPDDVVAVHEALVKLEAVDPQGSRVVELRFFGGLTGAETARVMGVAESTVYRAWEFARAWLFREMAR